MLKIASIVSISRQNKDAAIQCRRWIKTIFYGLIDKARGCPTIGENDEMLIQPAGCCGILIVPAPGERVEAAFPWGLVLVLCIPAHSKVVCFFSAELIYLIMARKIIPQNNK